jgi:hypothetical protein
MRHCAAPVVFSEPEQMNARRFLSRTSKAPCGKSRADIKRVVDPSRTEFTKILRSILWGSRIDFASQSHLSTFAIVGLSAFEREEAKVHLRKAFLLASQNDFFYFNPF